MFSKKINDYDKELATQICQQVANYNFENVLELIPNEYDIIDYDNKQQLLNEIKDKLKNQELPLYFSKGFCNVCYMWYTKEADIICFKSYHSLEILLSLAFIKTVDKKGYLGLKICMKPANLKEDLDILNTDNPIDL